MTDHRAVRAPARRIARALLRATGAVAVLTTIYFALPLTHVSMPAGVTVLVLGLALWLALIVYQVRSVTRSTYPVLRAIEALATSVPLFLLLFASTYLVMQHLVPTSFNEPMTHIDSLYFTVTTLATVGFGDIHATSQPARLVVTVQMIADLVIIGVAVRSIIGAARVRRDQS